MKSIFLIVFCFAIVLCSVTEESEGDKADKLVGKLFDAIQRDNVSEVQSLIDRGADANSGLMGIDGIVFTYPLHHAIGLLETGGANFGLETLKLLIKNGADLETVDFMDRTPLFKAVKFGNARAVKILLENGANPNAYNQKRNMSVLQQAFLESALISSCGEEIIDLLIEYGADVNQIDEFGRTPIHQATSAGHKHAIELLIKKGANVNAAESYWKMTPLHYIALLHHNNWTEDDRLQFAKLLLDHGADVYAKAHYQNHDQTAFDLTTSKKLKKLLRSKMGFMGWLRTIW